jgi:hypothetical protein
MLQFLPAFLLRSRPAAEPLPLEHGQTSTIADTINPAAHANMVGQDVINRVLWQAGIFDALFRHDPVEGDASITFPSPLPQGNAIWDTVAMDWHIARDCHGRFAPGPAVLVIDILHGGNRVSGFIAKKLAKNQIHGFVLHMPQTGPRCIPEEVHDWARFLPTLRQSVGDARRARDVIASLPLVRGPIGIQGTSLGGFVATLAAAIDNAFDPVLLALTGGDVYGVLTDGKRDAARVRDELRAVGFDDNTLRDWLWQIEPLRVAHRLSPERTWLFSARFDQVVPRTNGRKLAAAIGLNFQHRRELAGCHYTCVIGAGRFLSELVRAIQFRTLRVRSA